MVACRPERQLVGRRAPVAAALALAWPSRALPARARTAPPTSTPPSRLGQSTTIFAADGTLSPPCTPSENRETSASTSMPRVLRRRRRRHRGRPLLDAQGRRPPGHPPGRLRATPKQGEVAEGGSTITQQYVKNALLDADQTCDRKVQEAVLALQLERTLHQGADPRAATSTPIYFGNGAYGVQAAAQEYFGKPASEP